MSQLRTVNSRKKKTNKDRILEHYPLEDAEPLIKLVKRYVPWLREITKIEEILSLVWHNSDIPKYRQHKYDSQSFFIQNADIVSLLGKKYLASLEQSELIEVSYIGSLESAVTHGYRLTRKGQSLLFGLACIQALEVPNINKRRGPSNAIRSKASIPKGVDRKTQLQIPSFTPINFVNLHRVLLHTCLARLNLPKEFIGFFPVPEKVTAEELPNWRARRRNSAMQILNQVSEHPKSRLVGIYQQYKEAGSGRLYGRGVNLQHAPREIRYAALHGQFDYDFENCHWVVLSALAKQVNLETPVIDDYIEHKEEWRRSLAHIADASIKDVKKVLIALIYGSKANPSRHSNVGSTIGYTKAKKLISSSQFKDVKNELLRIRQQVIAPWHTKHKGITRITNPLGKSRPALDLRKPKNQLAHVLQGAEAKMLDIAVRQVLSDPLQSISLLQHDGFTSPSRTIDVEGIQETIYQRFKEDHDLELRITLSVEPIISPLSAYDTEPEGLLAPFLESANESN